MYSFSSTSHFGDIIISIYRLCFNVRNIPKALLAVEISFTVLRLCGDVTNDERKKSVNYKVTLLYKQIACLGHNKYRLFVAQTLSNGEASSNWQSVSLGCMSVFVNE